MKVATLFLALIVGAVLVAASPINNTAPATPGNQTAQIIDAKLNATSGERKGRHFGSWGHGGGYGGYGGGNYGGWGHNHGGYGGYGGGNYGGWGHSHGGYGGYGGGHGWGR